MPVIIKIMSRRRLGRGQREAGEDRDGYGTWQKDRPGYTARVRRLGDEVKESTSRSDKDSFEEEAQAGTVRGGDG